MRHLITCLLLLTFSLSIAGCSSQSNESPSSDPPVEIPQVEIPDTSGANASAPPADDSSPVGTHEETIAAPADPADEETVAAPPTEESVETPAETADEETADEETVAAPPTEESVETPADAADEETVAASTEETEPLVLQLGEDRITSGIPGSGELTIEEIKDYLADPTNLREFTPQLPMGLDAAAANITHVDENPLTLAKIELGRQLYFDPRLSSDGTISCASCHHPDEGFGRKTQFGVGVGGQTGNRNSPISYNRILSGPQFWDGRAASLEAQAAGPIAASIEMGNTHEKALETIKGIEGYQLMFDAVFPGEEITMDNVTKAIASFERAIVTDTAPYDHYERVRTIESDYGDELEELEEEDPELYANYQTSLDGSRGLSDSAKRGRNLFFSDRVGCTACHAGANFSDEKYHNLGVGMDADEPDLGRYAVTEKEEDKGAFKTPTLRNVVFSPPYMHDGSQQTLEEVVEWYNKGGHPNPQLSDKIKKLDLADQEKQDLVAFMTEGLSSDFPKIEQGRLP